MSGRSPRTGRACLLGSDLGNVDVEVADRIRLELLLLGLVAFDSGSLNPMTPQATMQRGSCQGRDRRLACIGQSSSGSNVCLRKATIIASSSIAKTEDFLCGPGGDR